MSVDDDLAGIGATAAKFFDAFTMHGSEVPNIDVLYDVFLPSAAIVNTVGGATDVCDVRTFVEPRRTLLRSGVMEDFKEYETSAETDVFGNIAQRFSRYEKTWRASGADRSGRGAKSIQFVRTPSGWKIASLIWDDVVD